MDVNFTFTLNTDYITKIEDKSWYNHNYYKLDLIPYGDYILAEKCDVLYEECDDISESAYYSLGYFDDSNKFVAMWTWLEDVKYQL